MFAVLAALSFGVTTPVIALAGQTVGPLTTAALLYLGACISALLLGTVTPGSGAPLRRFHLRRLALIAFFGAAVAPTLFAWGLQRGGAMTGSLLLNLEAVFTVLLARALHREPIGKRVAGAVSLMVLGGTLVALDSARSAGFGAFGAMAVAAATLAWALDNTLTRPLSEQNPVVIVAAKGALGTAMTGSLAFVFHEPLPAPAPTLVLLACGATGYGLSLRLYLLAQRHIGAARTGSIFAIAPFVGAAVAWAIGAGSVGALTVASAGLFGLGVLLHVTERHGHRHRHEPLQHEHAHRHDDGHHNHVHEFAVPGEHSHPHHHEGIEHDHQHAPDVHHGHGHSSEAD